MAKLPLPMHRANYVPPEHGEPAAIFYSLGRNIHDNAPAQRSAENLEAFLADLDAHRAPHKEGAAYFAGPLNGAGKRCAEGTLPRNWLAVDLDRIEPDALPAVRLWFARFRGAAWPTHSSRPEAPRERCILVLDREADRAEAIAVGEALAADLQEEFGQAIQIDPCTFRGEQPVFTPPVGVAIARFDGEPLNVERYLAAARKARPEPPERPTGGDSDEARPGEHEFAELVQKLGRKLRRGDGRREMLKRYIASRSARGLRADDIEVLISGIAARYFADPIDEQNLRELVAWAKGKDAGATAEPVLLDVFREIAAPALAAEDFPRILSEFAGPLARAAGHDAAAYLMAGLGAAAGAMGDHVRLLLDSTTSWFESARLWILLLGTPGTAKSPAIRAAMAPLFQIHRELRAAYAKEIEGLGNDEPRPPQPAVFVNDATVEKLSEILADNPRGIVAVFEELDTWLGAHDCYRGGQGSKDRGEWLRLFDGGPHQVDRIKRGSFFVPNWGCSILGATTPAGLRRHAKELPPDGLIQRFLPVLVRPMRAPDRQILSASVKRASDAFAERLGELHGAPAGTVRLSREAFAVFDARRDALRDEVQAFAALSEPFASHLAKHLGLLGRVALVMHGLEHGAQAAECDLSGATMQRAERLLRRLIRCSGPSGCCAG